MKDVGELIRQKLYERLNGAIVIDLQEVRVYDSASVLAEAYEPYILLSTFVSTELGEGSKQAYGQEVSVLIEVGTRFDNSFGGKLLSDRISNEVMELVRTRQDGYLDLSPDWYVIRTLMESTNTLEQLVDTGVLVRRLIRFTFKIQQGI
jgi:hypothetical protein